MSRAFQDPRLTERRNPDTSAIDTASSLDIVDLINAEDATISAAVAGVRQEVAQAIDLIEAAFRSEGRLIYIGAGTSGRLGVLDASECPPTFRSDPAMVVGVIAGGHEALVRSAEGAEDDRAAGAAAMDDLTVGEHDVVVGIAASGSTPYVQAALRHARGLGARTVSLSCSAPVPELREHSDIVIYVPVGPEVVTGSTRMKAGTATKMVLNTLSTGAMIRIGKVYGNLMVDLQAWSDKLVDRGERIVMETTGCDRSHARQAIEEAGGAVKTAIVMVKQSVDRDRAEALIADNDGRLRPILGDPPPVSSHD